MTRAIFGFHLIVLLASLTGCGAAQAWGDNAHRIICAIAFELALPNTQDEIQDIISEDRIFKSFSDSCIFPDHPRIRATEHYINLPRDSHGLTSYECPLADRCVLSAIKDDILALNTGEPASRLLALKSLGHWVGDIHQPLHVSFFDDRGGNAIKVSGDGCNNLHAMWDNCLVRDAVGLDSVKASTYLLDLITPEMKVKWNSTGPLEWANESFSVAESARTGYCEMHGELCDPPNSPVTMTSEYLDANKPIVREQLKKAGVRLAHLLDVALSK